MLQLFSHRDCQFYKVQFKTAEENKGGKSYNLSVVVTETPTLAQCFQYFFAIISVVHCHNVCRVIDKDTELLQYQYFFYWNTVSSLLSLIKANKAIG